MLDIQIFSDIHLEETSDMLQLEPRSEILFLAGDIGHIDDPKYSDFIKSCSEKWKVVISVLGNNELYSNSQDIIELIERYKKLHNKFANTFLLEKETMELGNIKIIGCISWGNFHQGHIGSSPLKIMVRDTGGKLKQIGCKRLKNMHEESIAWIQSQIDNSKNNIILTHFPVTLENEYVRQEKHRQEDRKVLDEFGCDLELRGKHLCCISGHTHHSHDFIKNDVRYISNQLGYHYEMNKTDYNENGQFIIFKNSNI